MPVPTAAAVGVRAAARASVGGIRWLKVAGLLFVQLRVLPRLWRRISRRKLQVDEADDLVLLQEKYSDGGFRKDVTIAGRVLSAGTMLLCTSEELKAAKLPFQLCYKTPWRLPGPSAQKWQGIIGTVASAAARAETPLLFWGWCHVTLQIMTWLVGHWFARWMSKKQMLAVHACAASLGNIINFTSLALFAHLLVSWWKNLKSRGRAEHSDVLGSQSSLREAQINALKVFLQVIVWSLYTCVCMWAVGINLGRVLLVPSITAVVIGWVGRELVANLMSGVLIHLTQPFAQGDWVTLESGHIDGWVQEIGVFYTRVVQWDKRPIYVPNFKIMTMNVQNNSRMTHRRILFDLPLRIRDIPKIPTIVQEIQEMINDHEDIDPVQHRLVRWREISAYSANIWVSCYTRPTLDGIRLGPWTSVQQSILERCSGVIYKNEAQFASTGDRLTQAVDGGGGVDDGVSVGRLLSESLFQSFRGEQGEQESQLQSREQALRQKEKGLKEQQRELEAVAASQAKKEQVIARAADTYKELLQTAAGQQKAASSAASEDAPAEQGSSASAKGTATETDLPSAQELPAAAAAALSGAAVALSGVGAAQAPEASAEPPAGDDGDGGGEEEASGGEATGEAVFRDLDRALERATAVLETPEEPGSASSPESPEAGAGHHDEASQSSASEALCGDRRRAEHAAGHAQEAEDWSDGESSDGGDAVDSRGAILGEDGANEVERAVREVMPDPDEGEPQTVVLHESEALHAGEVLHVKEAEQTRIPVKEMGD